MGEFFMSISSELVRIPGALVVIFPVGMVGLFVITLLMPMRAVWVLVCWLKKNNTGVTDRATLYLSNILLLISLFATFEFLYFMFNAGPGGFSGLMLPMFSFVPFLIYMFFELSRKGAHRVVEH